MFSSKPLFIHGLLAIDNKIGTMIYILKIQYKIYKKQYIQNDNITGTTYILRINASSYFSLTYLVEYVDSFSDLKMTANGVVTDKKVASV